MPKKMQDGELPKINMNSFIGGQATDKKAGTANSFYSSQAMDFRSYPSQMSVEPGLYNLSSTLQDLPLCMEQDPNGVRYSVGSNGYIYRLSTSNVISVIGQLNTAGSAGIFYNQVSDMLYIASQQTISLYGPVTRAGSSPSLLLDQFGVSASVANSVVAILNTSTNAYDGGTDSNTGLGTLRNNLTTLTSVGQPTTANVTNTLTNTYILPTSIIESTQNSATFVPDMTPIASISVYVTTVGTGNMSLTLHDSLNNALGTATISHANLVVGFNNFVFAVPGANVIPNSINSINGSSYHFHITSSVTNDTMAVATIAPQQLNGVNFAMFVYRMIQSANGWHPMVQFNNLLCIGNGNYLSTYNGGNDSTPNNTQYTRHALQFDFGQSVTSLAACGQYLLTFTEKRSNNTSRNYQQGFIYLWDGSSQNWIQRIPVTMGSPYSGFSINNVSYFICAGSLFAYTPGAANIFKVRYIAYQNTDYLGAADHTVVNPNMMTSRYNLLEFGYPSVTTNPLTPYGVYSWGAVEMTYPNSFGYSFVLANQMTNWSSSNNLQIGMVQNFVDSMYVSWQYTDASSVTHYGLDVLDNTSTVAPVFNWSSLIWDGGARYKMKKGMRVKISFLPLPSGTTLTPWVSIDRGAPISADPVTGTPYTATAGATNVLINLVSARSHELQWGFTGTANAGVTTPPTITAVTAEIDSLDDEPDLRQDG